MMRSVEKRTARRIIALIGLRQKDYRTVQQKMVSGSYEWKLYQCKINALNDTKQIIYDEFNLVKF